MKFFLSLIVLTVFISNCKSNTKQLVEAQTNFHKVVVQEVIQVSEYTYLRVLENKSEKWLAVPSIQAEKGKTYYYKDGMEMVNFESKELNRSFEKIYFITKISTDPNMVDVLEPTVPRDITQEPRKPPLEKKEIKIEPIEGVITIAELLKNKKLYEGKIIKVRGQVTKINPAIMKKNWIHLQDGTQYKDEFDLTITTKENVKVGNIITLQGKILLDQDYGFGYEYSVILENAELIK